MYHPPDNSKKCVDPVYLRNSASSSLPQPHIYLSDSASDTSFVSAGSAFGATKNFNLDLGSALFGATTEDYIREDTAAMQCNAVLLPSSSIRLPSRLLCPM